MDARRRSFAVHLIVLTIMLLVAGGPHPLLPRPVAHAQDAASQSKPVVGQAVGFAVSVPVREMGPETEPKISQRRGKDLEVEAPEKNTSPPLSGVEDPLESLMASVQTSAPELLIASPAQTFEGISNQDNFNDPVIGFRVLPPDTVGDVGPTQYVQAVNLLFRVFDKSGNALTPARPISALFSTLGGRCATTDDGDPIVLYDSFADRWIITQFAVSGDVPLSQCFAISQTGDATGAYYTYEFLMPNAKFNDYPKFGVWPDGYYWSNNQFNLAGTAFLGVGVFALDREKLLRGDPTASFVFFDLQATVPNARSMLPSDADGLIPPPPGAPNVFAYFNANEFVGETDSLRLYEFRANFANPASSTFTQRADSPLAVAAFDPRSPAGLDDIEQPPPATATSALDAISDRLMHRLQYRNFGRYEALTVNHTVNVGTGTTLALHQAGVRYYELRRSLPGGNWAVREQATFAPDTENRWMGSSAMDHQGNLAVGYSVSSLTTFPSIRYAGRLTGDPLGGLAQGEATLQAGSFSQTAGGSRWGDYSAMSVDPVDDCTFFYTQEYYAADNPATTAEWQTRVGSFKFAECTPVPRGRLQVNVTRCDNGDPLSGAAVTIDGNLYGTTLASGSFSTHLRPGSPYAVGVSRFGFEPAAATVAINDGATTTANVCLTPIPVMQAAGAVLGGESCRPATGTIDPGETVSVAFTVKNLGAAETVNLIATLLPTGGVTAPNGPHSYGVVPAAGGTGTRTFSFTADHAALCGGTLTATLSLQDGTRNLGTVTYPFTLGTLSNATTASSHSSGNLAVPIADNSTVDIPIPVGDLGVVADVNVRLRLNHTFDQDLVISLIAPDGTSVDLSSNNGGSGDNFGTGATNCSGTPTVFDDAGGISILDGAPPFAGTFRPEQPLSAFDGRPTAGTWKLTVSDVANVDVGTVFCVQLEINRRVYLCCPFAGGTPAIAAAPPATIVGESCSPANGAADPDETLTVSFPLQNLGTAPTTNLVATLLPTGGVNGPSGPQAYGALSPVGPTVAREFTFVPSGNCGDNVTATLHLQDGAVDRGNVTFTMPLGAPVPTPNPPSGNPEAITFPRDTPAAGDGLGPATPYPSTINVSGLIGTVNKVTVTLAGLSHTFPGDIDVLLVAPSGQSVILMSDAGGGNDAVGVTLTFDDAAAGSLPATLVSGTFRPTNIGGGDLFAAPAPPAPYGSTLAAFRGINPHGIWRLFAVDDAAVDEGAFAGGWSLNITTDVPTCCTQACSLTCPADLSVGNDPNQCRATVTYEAPDVTGSCGVVSCSPPSSSVFPVGTTAATCTGVSTTGGGQTGTCGFKVTVNDVQPPAVGNPSVSRSVLWPPNHKMVDVAVTYGVGDNCSAASTCSLSVTSNEPVNGQGDGNTAPDWEVVNAHLVRLRAERSGGGNGRIYTITVSCRDAAGNTSQRSVNVHVPHNR